MILLLLFLTVIAFVLFFYGIGLRYLWFLPFIFLIILITYYTTAISWKKQNMAIIEKHGMLFAWIVLLWWLSGVAHFMWLDMFMIAKFIFSLNLFLWILSYLLKYEDWKKIFQIWYYIALIGLFLFISLQVDISTILNLFTMIWALHIWVMSFFIFILGINHDIEEYLRYKLFVLIVWLCVLLIIHFAEDIYVAISLNMLLLTIIYSCILYLNKIRPISIKKQEDISLRRILAGEKICVQQPMSKSKPLQFLADFIYNMPSFAKSMLEWINILLIVLLSFVYVRSISTAVWIHYQILFWLTVVLFTFNVILLKKINYTSMIQRLVVFTVINFTIYASLLMFFKSQFGQIAVWGISWNIASTLLIFYTPKTKIGKLLHKRDYIFWIFTTMAALLANIFFLSKAQLAGQLMFSLIFLYLGLEAMIMFYALKYVRKVV